MIVRRCNAAYSTTVAASGTVYSPANAGLAGSFKSIICNPELHVSDPTEYLRPRKQTNNELTQKAAVLEQGDPCSPDYPVMSPTLPVDRVYSNGSGCVVYAQPAHRKPVSPLMTRLCDDPCSV